MSGLREADVLPCVVDSGPNVCGEGRPTSDVPLQLMQLPGHYSCEVGRSGHNFSPKGVRLQIDDDHLYHGAALTQIAEDPHFTAINALGADGTGLRNAFRVNANIGIHLKYSSSPKGQVKEYQFTFTREQLAALDRVGQTMTDVFAALVCVKARHICCLSLAQLNALVARRKKATGQDDDQYVILVTLPEGKGFRVYVKIPGRRGRILGKPLIVARKCFPGNVFERNA